ncbi:hypothetical protein DACRYDRAFT_19823 [Dacryopinax primogenitus]|uniref:Uncharacterized protein n=1 Tax=Dacryopinax primogenitus (strain DJM 731) TaxID=1858805 RepID=M5G939_DACPD|nr:uncharacterized protein DACRYDRAFT_19823 [Dacryopinax primogenitus]EJU05254.1 hypothetical protein DACRYDRAFT_19823 [Dacryopinax primogenitus]
MFAFQAESLTRFREHKRNNFPSIPTRMPLVLCTYRIKVEEAHGGSAPRRNIIESDIVDDLARSTSCTTSLLGKAFPNIFGIGGITTFDSRFTAGR